MQNQNNFKPHHVLQYYKNTWTLACKDGHRIQGSVFPASTLTKAEAFTWQHLLLSFKADLDSELFYQRFLTK
jgi:hypothetical protein